MLLLDTYALFRLRCGDTIVGQLRVYPDGDKRYSSDGFSWRSAPTLSYQEKDSYVGIRDKNNRPLFENDWVDYHHRLTGETTRCLLYYDAALTEFVLDEHHAGLTRHPLFAGGLALLSKHDLLFIGFSF